LSNIPKDVFKHIRRIQITTTRLAKELMVGVYHSAFKGKGMEFEEVREYVDGDDVRNIDWNVSARMNSPYIKNFREERELSVILLIDVSASSLFGSGKQLKQQFIAEIAAVLAFTAIKNNDNVGLLLFSDQVEEYIPAKKGLRHILRVIRDLLVFEPKNRGSDLKKALDFLGNIQKKSCVCFLLSDYLFDLCPHELAITAKKHDLIMLHVCDPAEEHFPESGLISMIDLESGIAQIIDTSNQPTQEELKIKMTLKKEEVYNLSKRINAGYIYLRSDQSYADPLRKFFKLRRIKH
jgi:uncharacterized protein (DUF58 family)